MTPSAICFADSASASAAIVAPLAEWQMQRLPRRAEGYRWTWIKQS